MATEPVPSKQGNQKETTTCPKCGFAQEDRLDCRKCGVVFSKYYALNPSLKNTAPTNGTSVNAQPPVDQDSKTAIADLQAQIKEISGRFAEVEFEKAERNQIRTDLKNLEQQLAEKINILIAQIEQSEKNLAQYGTSSNESKHDAEPQMPALLERLEEIEGKLIGKASLESLDEAQSSNVSEIKDVKDQIGVVSGQILEMRNQLDLLLKKQEALEPRTPIEEDVRAIRTYMEKLFQESGDRSQKSE